jgi:hypothetical protein
MTTCATNQEHVIHGNSIVMMFSFITKRKQNLSGPYPAHTEIEQTCIFKIRRQTGLDPSLLLLSRLFCPLSYRFLHCIKRIYIKPTIVRTELQSLREWATWDIYERLATRRDSAFWATRDSAPRPSLLILIPATHPSRSCCMQGCSFNCSAQRFLFVHWSESCWIWSQGLMPQ